MFLGCLDEEKFAHDVIRIIIGNTIDKEEGIVLKQPGDTWSNHEFQEVKNWATWYTIEYDIAEKEETFSPRITNSKPHIDSE